MRVGDRVALNKIVVLPAGVFDRPVLIPGIQGTITRANIFGLNLEVKFEIHFDFVPDIPRQDPIDMIVGWIPEGHLSLVVEE